MVNEILLKVISENYQEKIVEYDIKNFNENNFYDKKRVIFMIAHIIKKTSKDNYLIEIIKNFFEDKDEVKTLENLFKRSLKDFIIYYKDFLDKEEKKLKIEKNKKLTFS